MKRITLEQMQTLYNASKGGKDEEVLVRQFFPNDIGLKKPGHYNHRTGYIPDSDYFGGWKSVTIIDVITPEINARRIRDLSKSLEQNPNYRLFKKYSHLREKYESLMNISDVELRTRSNNERGSFDWRFFYPYFISECASRRLLTTNNLLEKEGKSRRLSVTAFEEGFSKLEPFNPSSSYFV